ncbi:hypothetical protein EWM60_11360 [Candidatus Erwinia dacicola]|nr:hypothetical protein [Candidatus Erwinia dacicola]
MKHIAELSTYGYRRVWALLHKESEDEGAETVNAKRVYRVMRDNHLLDRVPERQRVMLYGERNQSVQQATKSGAENNRGAEPAEQRMAESFVKTMERDYISVIPKPNRKVALMNLAVVFEHYNDKHPHSALEYRSPREYRRRRESLT